VMQQIHTLKRAVIFLRKSILPLREVVSPASQRVRAVANQRCLTERLYDHVVQVSDLIETCVNCSPTCGTCTCPPYPTAPTR